MHCRVIAGSANNQLGGRDDADRLRASGILYAPDFVINVGGGLHLYGLEQLSWDRPTLDRHLAGIGETLAEIFALADSSGISTLEAAERVGAARLHRSASLRGGPVAGVTTAGS